MVASMPPEGSESRHTPLNQPFVLTAQLYPAPENIPFIIYPISVGRLDDYIVTDTPVLRTAMFPSAVEIETEGIDALAREHNGQPVQIHEDAMLVASLVFSNGDEPYRLFAARERYDTLNNLLNAHEQFTDPAAVSAWVKGRTPDLQVWMARAQAPQEPSRIYTGVEVFLRDAMDYHDLGVHTIAPVSLK